MQSQMSIEGGCRRVVDVRIRYSSIRFPILNKLINSVASERNIYLNGLTILESIILASRHTLSKTYHDLLLRSFLRRLRLLRLLLFSSFPLPRKPVSAHRIIEIALILPILAIDTVSRTILPSDSKCMCYMASTCVGFIISLCLTNATHILVFFCL